MENMEENKMLDKNNIGKACTVKSKGNTFNNYSGIIRDAYYGYYLVAIEGDSRVLEHFKPENLSIKVD